MDEEGLVKVRCKYSECSNSKNTMFNCGSYNNYVACGITKINSFVTWTYYVINAKHLTEVKDE